MCERWRAVEGFRGYEVSDLGRVRSSLTSLGPQAPLRRVPRVIKLGVDGDGKPTVRLAGKFGRVTRDVQALVAAAFGDPVDTPAE